MRAIKRRLEDAKLLAEKRTRSNYKTAIPQYFPRQDIMSLYFCSPLSTTRRLTLLWSSRAIRLVDIRGALSFLSTGRTRTPASFVDPTAIDSSRGMAFSHFLLGLHRPMRSISLELLAADGQLW
jgi:hypothetical protein